MARLLTRLLMVTSVVGFFVLVLQALAVLAGMYVILMVLG